MHAKVGVTTVAFAPELHAEFAPLDTGDQSGEATPAHGQVTLFDVFAVPNAHDRTKVGQFNAVVALGVAVGGLPPLSRLSHDMLSIA
jgi:hypothetical protein